MAFVDFREQFIRRDLSGVGDFRRWFNVRYRHRLAAENYTLMLSRQKPIAPIGDPARRQAATVWQDGERRQVRVFRAEPIAHPGPDRREALEDKTSGHLEQRRPMSVAAGDHGMDKSQIVGALGQVWKQV